MDIKKKKKVKRVPDNIPDPFDKPVLIVPDNPISKLPTLADDAENETFEGAVSKLMPSSGEIVVHNCDLLEDANIDNPHLPEKLVKTGRRVSVIMQVSPKQQIVLSLINKLNLPTTAGVKAAELLKEWAEKDPESAFKSFLDELTIVDD